MWLGLAVGDSVLRDAMLPGAGRNDKRIQKKIRDNSILLLEAEVQGVRCL